MDCFPIGTQWTQLHDNATNCMRYNALKDISCIIMDDFHYLFHSLQRIKKVMDTNDFNYHFSIYPYTYILRPKSLLLDP
jgi:hypothetical protein